MESLFPKERFVVAELKQDEKRVEIALIIIGLLFVALIANLMYLNVQLFKRLTAPPLTATLKTNQPVPTPQVPPLSSPTLVPQPTYISTSNVEQTTTSVPYVKEYFIPLGAGSSQATDWTDVTGVQAAVDFGKYQHIKEVRFEASIAVPNAHQTVGVRLYNITDKHPVWYSDLVMNADSSSAYLTSSPITYDTGDKLYTVQMKTQLGASTDLIQSRIHIILQ